MTISESSFVFNLGRLWQEVLSGNWDGVINIYELIEEVTSNEIIENYSKELEELLISIKNKDCEGVDKVLNNILKW
ncbi:MAG: hypothetical protein B6D57_00205 [Candidatus Coatesbacteria bacterium 4484_99]|uniref:Uncharacterized protein n=1 Tax=Candidatus Coatesbacteria bacterium 4484_99 TaxID=1970774 RepID=A0A1W9S3Q6_9BACT|nr:MAG: hypothetical protein B6D57_00205 [Candidatus Coatesbacteria bacterium 4484_99]